MCLLRRTGSEAIIQFDKARIINGRGLFRSVSISAKRAARSRVAYLSRKPHTRVRTLQAQENLLDEDASSVLLIVIGRVVVSAEAELALRRGQDRVIRYAVACAEAGECVQLGNV